LTPKIKEPFLNRRISLIIFALFCGLITLAALLEGAKDQTTKQGNNTNANQQALLAEAVAKVAPPTAQPIPERRPAELRRDLAAEYSDIIAAANPHLNFIKQKTTKVKGGYAIWAVHEYFTSSTFSIGEDAKLAQAWISRNHAELKRAGIVRVGVQNTSGWLGSCWFEVQ